MQGLVVEQGRLAAEQRQPCAAAVAHAVDYLQEPNLAAVRYVRRAAGAAVHALDLHYAHLARQLLLAAVVHRGELAGRGQKRAHRHVAPYRAVRLQLGAGEVLARELAREVYGYRLLAHVEAHVVIAEKPVHSAGEDVLAGVALHPRKAQRPVNPALHQRTRLQRRGREVHYVLALLAQSEQLHIREDALVGLLAAAAGEERAAVQLDRPGSVLLLAGRDSGREPAEMSVRVIQFFSQIYHLFVQ